MKRFVCGLLAICSLLGLCACAQQPEETEPTLALNDKGELILSTDALQAVANEGNNRAFYHIFVGSFSDSNGDGTGDLRGIINRFDYLNDGDPNSGTSLGVEGIWLSPIFISPSYHKYDTSDYYQIDPKFGTMADLQELIALCHSRGVKIILDLVINHTSRGNTWYQKFADAHVNGNTGDPYYDFYTWADDTSGAVMWYSINGTSQYYEGNFSSEMPELNFDNPDVRQAMVDVAKYYLDMGIDGFRFDAAKYIYYGDDAACVEFWDWYMEQLRAIKPDIYTVAEVWSGDAATFPYFSATNCFNFSMSQSEGRIATAAKGGNCNSFVNYVAEYLGHITQENPNASMVTFIANHDTDRAAGFLTVSSGQAYVAANLSMLLPGSTFIYYGEEIGMLGSRGGANTDANRRLAMLWGDEDTVKNPVGTTYSAKQANGTVADQLGDPDSLYNHYKKLIQIRKAYPEIVYGSFTPIKTTSKLGAFAATLDGSTVVVLHNTTTADITVDLTDLTDIPLTVLAAYVGMGVATLEGTTLIIPAQTSVILK